MQTSAGRRLAEPLILLVGGAFLLQISRHRDIAEAYMGGGEASARCGAVLHQCQFVYGVLLLILALGSYLLSRGGDSLSATLLRQMQFHTGRLPKTAGGDRPPSDLGRRWLWIAMTIGSWLRICFLDQPMRYDESFSFLSFVKGSYSDLFYYPLPNNHVLYTILEKLSVLVVGPSPVGIRLPALLFGVALIPATWGLCRKLDRASSGIFASIGIAVMPFLVLYSTNGRGYSLLALLAVLIPYVMLESDGRILSSRWLLPALLSALGMFVIPSMLYVLTGLFAWLTWTLAIQTRNWKETLSFLAPYTVTTTILTLLFYTPVAIRSGGWDSLTSNRLVQPLPAAAFEAGIVPHLLGTVQDLTRSIPETITMLTMILGILGLYVAFRNRNHALLLLLPSLLLGAAALFVAKRSIPFSRTWIYLIPFLLIASDVGISRGCSQLSPSFRKTVMGATTALAILFAFGLASQNSIAAYPETGRVSGGSEVARFLSPMLSLNDAVCAKLPTDSVVAYYLWRDIVPDSLQSRPANNRLFIIRTESGPQGADDSIKGATRLFISSETALYEWTAPDAAPEAIGRYTCWSPAALAGA